MRITAFLFSAALALLPALVWADVPPPPDDYSGPASLRIAGLDFTHERLREYGPADAPAADRHPLGWDTYVVLTDCDAKHPNCKLAKKLGAIGGSVTTVDGKDVGGDVAVVQAAFAAAKGHRVRLIIAPESAPEYSFDNLPPGKVVTGPITLDVSAQ